MLFAQLELFTKRNNPYSGQPVKKRKADIRLYVLIARSQDTGRGIAESDPGGCSNKGSKKSQKVRK